MGCRAFQRFWKSSRSRMRATVIREARRTSPAEPRAESQRPLNSMAVFSGSRIRNACFVYVRALAWTSSGVSWGRVAFFPEGSPIMAVKSPITKTTRCPAS